MTTRIGGVQRRKQLIASAIRLFGHTGFDGTSLDAVADAAGVRKQTLLYYFPTKDALFEACVDDLSARISAALSLALDGPEGSGGSARADLAEEGGFGRAEAVIRAMFRLAAEWPDFPSFIREASLRGPAVVARIAGKLEPLRKRALVYLEKEMAEGGMRRQDPGLLLFTLYTAVVGSITEAGVLRAVAGGASGRGALKRREEELVSFLRVALTGRDASS